jgi:hypothetical protein
MPIDCTRCASVYVGPKVACCKSRQMSADTGPDGGVPVATTLIGSVMCVPPDESAASAVNW